jgi:hypothetical protein
LFELECLLAEETPHIIFITGESGVGKSTYVYELIDDRFDPIWLDCALIDDACDALATVVRSTGYTGDLSTFLATLQAYAGRDGWARPAIVLDALDEWSQIRPRLRRLIDVAAEAGLKIIIIGRPQPVELLLSDERLLAGVVHARYNLGCFNEDERARAEDAYRAAFDLQSVFSGRALELSRLPAMMAAISETYEGSVVNPDLTEPNLYIDYRAKKALSIARKESVSIDRVESQIQTLASRMLELDAVSLSFRDAEDAAPLLESFISEGLLLRDMSGRHVRVRFRFGRFRDDALASSSAPFAELFEAVVVGRSALIYAAGTDKQRRLELLAASITESPFEGVILARDFDWWDELADVLPESLTERQRLMVLVNVGRSLAKYPRLLNRLGVDAQVARFAAIHGATVSRETWRAWLADLEDLDIVASLCQITLRMLCENSLTLGEAAEFAEICRGRYARTGRFSNDSDHFWSLVQEICKRLPGFRARRFLRDILPTFPLVHSTAGNHMGSFYHGLDHAHGMLEAVGELRRRLSPRAFEAWASSTLLQAYSREYRQWGDFRGTEMSGSERDNGWVADVIVPAMREALLSDGLAPRLKSYRISRLHPAFRLRAMIASSPIKILEAIPDTMMAWRRMPNTGIPSLSEALEQRSAEAALIPEQGLDDAMERFEHPISAAQSALLHRRIEVGDRKAIAAARRFLNDPQFVQADHFLTKFVEQMDWVNRRPRLAVVFLSLALRAGYPVIFLGLLAGYRTLFDLILRRSKLKHLVSGVPGMNNQLAYALRGSDPRVRRRMALQIYNDAGPEGKRQILFWVHELPLELALTIVRQAFLEDEPTPSTDDDVSDQHSLPHGTFHADLWSTLVYCWQQWRQRWFHLLGHDLVESAQTFSSPADVAATIMPLSHYAVEFRTERAVIDQIIDYVIDRGRTAGPRLRAYIARHTTNLCPAMTALQLENYLAVYADTPTAIGIAWSLVRQRGLPANEARLLAYAETHEDRAQIATSLWREIHSSPRQLSDLETRVVDRLVERANDQVLREIAHLATAVSQVSAASATELLMKVLHRALAVNAPLPEPYQMRYAWGSLPAQTILNLADDVASKADPSWLLIKLAGDALCEAGIDAARTRNAFERLVNAHEGARDAYSRWRLSISG